MTAVILKRYGLLFLICLLGVLVVREVSIYLSTPCTALQRLHESLQSDEPHSTIADVLVKSAQQPALRDDPSKKDLRVRRLTNHRLKLWYGGRCIDADADNTILLVDHCNPDLEQLFEITEGGNLVYKAAGLCVNLLHGTVNPASPELGLGNCDKDSLKFSFDDETGFLSVPVPDEKDARLCVSAASQQDPFTANLFPCLSSPVSLTKCDVESSRLELLEESEFRKDREIFVNVEAPADDSGSTCDFKACGLNQPVEVVKNFRANFASHSTNPFDCVTVITKTARRPYLVTRLAQSIRDQKGYDLRIICLDDGPNDYPQEVWDEISKYPHLQYIVGEDEDMGISAGRNIALNMVKTKYFLLVDDDHVFNNKTNIEKMVDILDTSDATIVGGKFEGFIKFAGSIRFGYYHKRQEFGMFSGHCDRDPGVIPSYPNCEQCDSTSNIFLAKTQPIIKIGGWSVELKIAEHADFFVKVKGAGLKVVYCDDIEVINQQETPDERSHSYQKLRYDGRRKNRMFRLMNSRYNVNGLFWCSRYEVAESGDLICLETRHKIGYC